MIKPPVKRMNSQVITTPYGTRIINGKENFHNGIDLRSVRFEPGMGFVKQWGLQDIQATEESEVLRFGTDKKGNDFLVVKPLISNYIEIKYIHVTLEKFVQRKGMILNAGDKIGNTQIKGSSPAHHLHFEIWAEAGGSGIPINPLIYFDEYGIKYKIK